MVAVPNEDQQNYIKWALDAVTEGMEDYQKYEDYYVGDHDLAFATTKWDQAFGTIFEEFADNWCQVVVDACAQRMEILGWKSTDKTLAKKAEQIWDENWAGNEADDLHTQTLVKGDGYLFVQPSVDRKGDGDGKKADIFYNDALETQVVYDPTNRRKISRAAKRYVDAKGQTHLWLYFPKQTVHLYVPSDATEAQVAAMSIGTTEWQSLPAGWLLAEPPIVNPYGRVPIFHFRNRNMGAQNGLSELKIIIPIQNAVNKLLMDLMVASEFGSFRQKYIAGGGQPAEGWKVGGDRVWATSDPNARFGEFGQVDLEPIFKAVEMAVGHIAKVSQTPMHYLRSSGDMPSGEALKSAESGLIKKCFARQKQWGTPWTQVMDFAVTIETGEKPSAPIYPVWKSPETRHELEQAQTAQLKSILGVPLEHLWSEHFGYTEEEIAEFKKLNHAIAASVLADVLVQVGQAPPGTEPFAGNPEDLINLIKEGQRVNGDNTDVDVSNVLALLKKSATAQTTAGEATTKPQPNTRPPASPTRRSIGFKD